MSIQIFPTRDHVVCRTKKKQIKKPPPLPIVCGTHTTLPTAPHLNVRFSYKNSPNLSLSNFTPIRKNFMWKFRLLSSTAMTPGIIQIMRLIFVLEPFNFQSRRRFEVCITCDKVLSNYRAIFLI